MTVTLISAQAVSRLRGGLKAVVRPEMRFNTWLPIMGDGGEKYPHGSCFQGRRENGLREEQVALLAAAILARRRDAGRRPTGLRPPREQIKDTLFDLSCRVLKDRCQAERRGLRFAPERIHARPSISEPRMPGRGEDRLGSRPVGNTPKDTGMER